VPGIKLFFSHITAESNIVDFLQAAVQRDFIGLVKVFVSSDRTSVPVGSKWLDELTAAMKGADLHAVLCSPESIARPWINFEAGAAHLRSIPIIPLCHSGLVPAHLPVPISVYGGVSIATVEGIERLYIKLASTLDSQLPAVDFEQYAAKLQSFESEYAKQRSDVTGTALKEGGLEIIVNPKALCVSSRQFLALGFENQLQKILQAFPASVQHDVVFDGASLRKALTHEKFDIVHVGAFICPRSGDVYFSDVDLHTGLPTAEPRDTITAADFAVLLKISETRLVVITSCDSLSLTASLIAASHVVAARDMVSANMMAAWVDGFYSMLVKRPLSQALEFAIQASGAPMRLHPREPAVEDLRMQITQAA
jgi:hypothetical protein